MEEKFRIVLCIKPIKSELVTQEKTTDQDVFQMNPFDLGALEVLVDKRKTQEDFILTCLCMGDKRTESMLRRALAMGADEAILVSDRAFTGSDTVATSYILERAMKQIENVKLIVCGLNTIDGETGQVPQALAERLEIRHIVKGHDIENVDANKLVFKDKDSTTEKLLKVALPAIMKFTDFKVGIPSISLLAMKKAKNKEIITLDKEAIQADENRCGLAGSKTQVLEIKNRIAKKEKTLLEGDECEIARSVSSLLGIAIKERTSI